MYRTGALLSLTSLLAIARGQQVGTNTAEVHPSITWQKCTGNQSCTTQNGKIVLDANWRWLHTTTGYTNCYTGNTVSLHSAPFFSAPLLIKQFLVGRYSLPRRHHLRSELRSRWCRLQRNLRNHHLRQCPHLEVRHHRRQHQRRIPHLPHEHRHHLPNLQASQPGVLLRCRCFHPPLWSQWCPLLLRDGRRWWTFQVPHQQGWCQVRNRILRLSVPP